MGIDGEEYCIGHWMASNQIKEFLTNQIFSHRRKKSVFWAAAVSQRRAERGVPHLTFVGLSQQSFDLLLLSRLHI